MSSRNPPRRRAFRATAPGSGERLDEVAAHARELGVMGWVRAGEAGGALVHAEGAPEAVDALRGWLDARDVAAARVEGHEQFGIRGVSAGAFVVQEHQATAHHFDLRLQVGEAMRSWAVPKGPSLDPAVKRFAVQVGDHSLAHNDFEGASGRGGVIIWDRGTYEQGGRVAWPEAIERGHAVFVLHGEKLRGGFALQRTRGQVGDRTPHASHSDLGEKPQWLLVKRRDEQARPGSDIVAEAPASVVSGQTLADVVGS